MRALPVILLLVVLVCPCGPARAVPSAGFSRPMMATDCPCLTDDPAPDWSSWSHFRGIWGAEQGGPLPPAGGLLYDASLDNNRLDPGGPGAGVLTTRAVHVQEGCRAISSTDAVGKWNCNVPDCAEGDFCPVDSPFTAGNWIRPDDVVAERWTISTDGTNSSTGSGYNIGWKQAGAGTGQFLFQIDPDGGSGPTELLSTTTATPNTYHHSVGRFFYRPGTGTGTMEQLIDGVLDASTTTSAAIDTCDFFSLGVGNFSTALTGEWDELFYADAAMDDASICRVAVCGITGCACSCDSGDPTTYDFAPKHTSFGGTLTCTLPACNATTPSTILPTTTTTSTTTSTTL